MTHNQITEVFRACHITAEVSPPTTAPQLINYHITIKPQDVPRLPKALMALRVISGKLCDIVQAEHGGVILQIPRDERETLTFAQVYRPQGGNLPLVFGVGTHGERVTADLAELPHLLISGTTGSGKSTALHTLILSLLCHSNPHMLLIDPKRIELSSYANITSRAIYNYPIIHESPEALKALQIINRIITDVYDKKRAKQNIIVIIDELAELTLNRFYGAAITEQLIRIAQIGRAASVHLILCTQRPTVKVLDGLLLANIPARLALRAASVRESVIMLDKGGAERLQGKGDALLRLPDRSDLIRLQVPFTTATDVERATL